MNTAPATPVAGQPARPESASAIATRYLTAFYSGDFDAARSVVAEDFSFCGPFLRVDSREAFFDGARGLGPIVRGHRLQRQWEDGPDVCSVYEVDLETPAGTGSILMSEWHTIRDGQLASGRVVFDTAEFRALVPQR
jgi:ketosteroid isomerase-like protein